MSTTVKTSQEFYQLVKDEAVALAPDFTDFSPGSMLDIINGAISMGFNEISELIISEFSKTFFELAEGDDLDKLMVDHFGTSFARTGATFATGSVTFSRANDSAGDVFIASGTVVKSVKNAQGVEVRFMTTADANLTGTTVSVPVIAAVAGVSGNAIVGKITVIEGALTDPSVVVTNSADMAGGAEKLTDPEYREFGRLKLLSLAGATEAAVKGAASSVPGVGFVTLATLERAVIDYDIANEQILPGATFFRIPFPVIYVADANGNSSAALVEAVRLAVFPIKALGVKIEVKGAIAYEVDWTASVTLNPAGPNYAELQSDLTKILDSMKEYIDSQLAINSGFVRANANAYILSVWGPAGTNDLTAFSTAVPAGDVAGAVGQKLVAGDMVIV